MLCQPQSVIRKLPKPISTGDRKWIANASLSTTENSSSSTKNWKNNESEGTGLAMVTALDKPLDENPWKTSFCAQNYQGSAPMPISLTKNSARRGCVDHVNDVKENNSRFSDHVSWGSNKDKDGVYLRNEEDFYCGLSNVADDGNFRDFEVADFLSYCHMCRQGLYGKDIYMYRGEKAFCSTDCRHWHIDDEEGQEKCGLDASELSTEFSSSPNSSQLFFPGIIVS